ncbi:hypothetical protein TGME49_295390 [Toxoplasma gondii ME49]|uniref:Uncharacterized protein n=2 Tax=Toxoplasma gondii TaxID=5811 RepID=A0A125YQ88_TOXGV|nr:hypothetical protein TGME49_295390 [Toxoplasma gondii ME49]EPT32477.1 hypothetical protein TGME49_295390 [Toxoplasma gondii ME49]ESS29129.1 hypothetical protein TGVEG_295390 [Toxoplasma gondii VEG]|eukprot:XP_018638524.1 hypothetical protein TGME49_295390 [Toxoplasma gondii ME49]
MSRASSASGGASSPRRSSRPVRAASPPRRLGCWALLFGLCALLAVSSPGFYPCVSAAAAREAGQEPRRLGAFVNQLIQMGTQFVMYPEMAKMLRTQGQTLKSILKGPDTRDLKIQVYFDQAGCVVVFDTIANQENGDNTDLGLIDARSIEVLFSYGEHEASDGERRLELLPGLGLVRHTHPATQHGLRRRALPHALQVQLSRPGTQRRVLAEEPPGCACRRARAERRDRRDQDDDRQRLRRGRPAGHRSHAEGTRGQLVQNSRPLPTRRRPPKRLQRHRRHPQTPRHPPCSRLRLLQRRPARIQRLLPQTPRLQPRRPRQTPHGLDSELRTRDRLHLLFLVQSFKRRSRGGGRPRKATWWTRAAEKAL